MHILCPIISFFFHTIYSYHQSPPLSSYRQWPYIVTLRQSVSLAFSFLNPKSAAILLTRSCTILSCCKGLVHSYRALSASVRPQLFVSLLRYRVSMLPFFANSSLSIGHVDREVIRLLLRLKSRFASCLLFITHARLSELEDSADL